MVGIGESTIRGINVTKMLKGFAEENLIFKKMVTNSKSTAEEIRWYQKTAGFLDTTDSTGMTASRIPALGRLSKPETITADFTRNTSYARKFAFESEPIPIEDIKGSDVQVLQTHVRDVGRAIAKQVNDRIYNILTESQSPVNINSTASTAAWDDGSVNAIKDIMTGIRKIMTNNYVPDTLLLSPIDYQNLVIYLVDTKGSSIPEFSSDAVKTGMVGRFLGLNVVVSNSVAADSACIAAMKQAVTYQEFMPMSSAIITDEGVSKTFRGWTIGEALLTDPKAVHLTTNTQT